MKGDVCSGNYRQSKCHRSQAPLLNEHDPCGVIEVKQHMDGITAGRQDRSGARCRVEGGGTRFRRRVTGLGGGNWYCSGGRFSVTWG